MQDTNALCKAGIAADFQLKKGLWLLPALIKWLPCQQRKHIVLDQWLPFVLAKLQLLAFWALRPNQSGPSHCPDSDNSAVAGLLYITTYQNCCKRSKRMGCKLVVCTALECAPPPA